MKRVSTFLMVLLLLCAMTPWSSAAQANEMQPLWTYVTKVNGTLDISNTGMAKVTAKGGADSKGVTKITVSASLQQLIGGTWKELKSWTSSSDGTSVSLSEKSWSVAHGYSYRVVASVKAYTGTALLEQGSSIQNFGYFA